MKENDRESYFRDENNKNVKAVVSMIDSADQW